jgi:hypothetical protein
MEEQGGIQFFDDIWVIEKAGWSHRVTSPAISQRLGAGVDARSLSEDIIPSFKSIEYLSLLSPADHFTSTIAAQSRIPTIFSTILLSHPSAIIL